MNKDWTKQEEIKLRHLYPNTYCRELQKIFGCSRSAILRRARKLGLKSHLQSMGGLKYSFNAGFFSKPTVLNSYYAGFMAADGCICTPKHRTMTLQIELHHKDRIVLDRFKEDIHYTGPIRYIKQKKRGDTVLIQIHSKKLCEDLCKNFNITPRKSRTLKHPTNLSPRQIISFIIGYIDGDGSIFLSQHKYLNLSVSGTKSIVTWIKHYLELFTKISSSTKSMRFCKVWYYRVYCSNATKMLKVLNQFPIKKLERKWDTIFNGI
jgi:hypothetical protein